MDSITSKTCNRSKEQSLPQLLASKVGLWKGLGLWGTKGCSPIRSFENDGPPQDRWNKKDPWVCAITGVFFRFLYFSLSLNCTLGVLSESL